MRRVIAALLMGILTLMTASQQALAEDDSAKAVALVKDAIQYYKTAGLEQTLEELSNPTGKFKKGDIYVFVYDLQGTMLAHPNNTLIGQNLLEVPDAAGKLFRKEIISGAKSNGSGWVEYQYQNPKTKGVEAKTTYFEKVDDLIVCCGIFREKR